MNESVLSIASGLRGNRYYVSMTTEYMNSRCADVYLAPDSEGLFWVEYRLGHDVVNTKNYASVGEALKATADEMEKKS